MAVAERIYAKALFDAARSRGRPPEVRSDFADLTEALEQSPELRNLLRNPQIDARAKRAGIDAVFADAEEAFRNFLKVLAEKGRLAGGGGGQAGVGRLVARRGGPPP